MLLKWYEARVGKTLVEFFTLQYYGKIHIFFKGSKSLLTFGENGEQGGAVVRAPMCPGFDSRTRRHM